MNGKRHGHATDPRSCRGDAIGEAPAFAEPLRDNREGGDVDEATAHPYQDALRQEQLPDLVGERGSDKPAGHAQDAGRKGEFDVEMAAGFRSDRRHEHGHGEVEAADEGVLKRRRAGEDIVVDVVGKEDTERLP